MTGQPFYKVPRLESVEYTRWVKSLPCKACGKWPPPDGANDPHHRVGHGRCAGVKVDDYETMPLCRGCHDALHGTGWEQWELDTGKDQRAMTVATLMQAIRDGVLVLDKRAAKYIGGE